MDQPGKKVASPARGQLKNIRENGYFPVSVCLRLRIWTRETGSAMSRPASAYFSFSTLRLNMMLTRGIPPDFRGGVQLFI